MNDYMSTLHQRFYREPDFSDLEADIENTRQKVRDCLDKFQRHKLLHLVATQNLLRKNLPGKLRCRVQTGLGIEQRTGGGRPVLFR